MGVPLWPGLPGAAPGGSSAIGGPSSAPSVKGSSRSSSARSPRSSRGSPLASITAHPQALPSLFILLPAAAGMQDTIFGAIGARFGTSSAAGLFEITPERTGIL